MKPHARDMIVVLPDSKTVHNGSMYSSSVTTGDCEQFIARDVVAYVDTGRLHDALDLNRIVHRFEVYAGTHTSRVAYRFQNHVMPFFSDSLCTGTPCR